MDSWGLPILSSFFRNKLKFLEKLGITAEGSEPLEKSRSQISATSEVPFFPKGI